MDKYALFPGKAEDGRPRIHLVEPGSRYGLSSTDGLTKTASGEHLPQVMELIESIEAQPGRLYLVNSALGAGEFVGFNLRGDWFTEKGLNHTPHGFEDIPVWDIDARRKAANKTEAIPRWGSLAWGYPTFYNAHRFRHHVNKDPNKAYGFILGAFWDDRMKRVILVSELIKTMCAKMGALSLYNRIAGGEFPDSSMGSKVPYDRCSICNHHARTPMEYCEHVRKGASPPYGMKSLLPDGRVCGVYNDYPRFFDDSFVFVGAERSAKVMSNVTDQISGSNPYTQKIYPFIRPMPKVASAEDEQAPTSLPATKVAEMPKWAEMLKKIPAPSSHQMSIVRREEECLPELPREMLDIISENPGPNLRASARLGIIARPREFQYIMMRRRDPVLAQRLYDARQVFRPTPLSVASSKFDARSFVPQSAMRKIVQMLAPMIAERSFAPKAIRIRITKMNPMAKIATTSEIDGLDEISDLYNQYRLGIMSAPPDLQAVTVPVSSFSSDIETDVKTAEDSVSLSDLMMKLAYWPGLTLGLHSSAEGNASEEAVTPEPQNGEIHHVTP